MVHMNVVIIMILLIAVTVLAIHCWQIEGMMYDMAEHQDMIDEGHDEIVFAMDSLKEVVKYNHEFITTLIEECEKIQTGED